MSDEKRNPHDGRRVLVTFGRSDPLHLTEATIVQLGMSGTPIEHIGMVWGPDFNQRHGRIAVHQGGVQ